MECEFEIEADTQEDAEDLFYSIDTSEPELLYSRIIKVEEID